MNTDDFNKLSKESREEVLELAAVTARVFNSEDGKRLLDFWEKKFIMTEVANPNKTADQRLYDGGKQAFVLGIKQAISIHHNTKITKG